MRSLFMKMAIVLVSMMLVMPSTIFAAHRPIPEGTSEFDIKYERPAPDFIIQKANEYIIGFVGKDYFNSYFSLNDSYKIVYPVESFGKDLYGKDQYIVGYFYNIPHKDVFRRDVGVRFDLDGNIAEYTGPKKPYKFLITKDQAIKIAKQNGIENIEDWGIHAWGNWEVYGPTTSEGWDRNTVYIDVDTGEVLRRTIDTGIREPSKGIIASPNPIPAPGVPGGIWYGTPVELSELLIPVSVIIVLIIAFIWFVYHKKK